MTETFQTTPADVGAVVAIGIVTALALALVGTSPTGSIVTDVVVMIVGCVAAVWCGSTAPWWAIAGLAGLGAVLADGWIPLLAATAVFCAAAVLGGAQREHRWIWALLMGASIVVLAGARELGAWGVNALVAIVAVTVVAVLGAARQPDHRRATVTAVGVIAGLAVLAVGGLAYAANDARGDISDANGLAREGLQQLEDGDFDAAQATFAEATVAFERATDAVASPLAQPSRLVPVASQHLAAATDITEAAERTSRTIVEQLDVIDLDSLSIVDGRIDIDAVRGLTVPMNELQNAIVELDGTIDEADSGWLIPPVQDRLADLEDDLARQRRRGDNALAALDVAPAMLGADGERVYFVMFTTPAEARGQGGFMGNWAEITIDDGRIEMTAFGNDEVLNEGAPRPTVLENAPAGWMARYGQFGFNNGPDGGINVEPWKNITMSPDFPATSQVVAELYPKSGGRDIDGVISLDVYAIEELIGLVGPIEVEGAPYPLTGDNTSQFLLLDQYLEFPDVALDEQEERADMLEAVTRETLDLMLFESPPDPLDLGKAMAPLAERGRVLAWSAHEDEQAVYSSVGLDGVLRSDDSDVATVSFNNAGGGKIDVFLEQEVEVVDGDNGPEIHFHLENTAPASGLPPYLIQSLVGLPDGYSKLWVTAHASVPILSAIDDGEVLDTQESLEAGLNTLAAMVVLEPGESTTVVFPLDAPDKVAADFAVPHQPAVRP